MTATAKSTTASEASFALLFEEIIENLESGEEVDVEAYVRQYPDHAERLRRLLPAVGMLAELGRSAAQRDSAGLAVAGSPDHELGVLGDFRLLCEVGRGGMGVVYEAEQISLRRKVALKVLPLAGMMDPRHLQRFRNEAQAAACLHHGNIVPVYAVGQDRGVHFYAMQLIEGQTLAAAIQALARSESVKPLAPRGRGVGGEGSYSPLPVGEGLGVRGDAQPPHPQPLSLKGSGEHDKPVEGQQTTPYNPALPAGGAVSTAAQAGTTALSGRGQEYFRTVARLGVQAAEALDYAHQLGVVHRDIKPANLMLDARGTLWVTDFGLAHIQHGEAGLTMTGDLVGTLRYMSPEQALAKRVLVDHRTDVYSLGATLYELLTLRPVFAGEDRQELLRQLAFEEPTPPRRINKAIPAELETVVLKALEKNPAERYATAQELAADLKCFLEDRPIQARRPTLVQRSRKWARRHRPAVTATAVCLLVTLTVLVGCGGWVLGDRAARQDKVREALAAAGPGLREGNPYDPALISAAQRGEAQLSGGLVGRDSRRRVEQLQKDVRMLAELERIRLDQATVRDGHFDATGSNPKYAGAFRDYGIDVETLWPAEAAALVRDSAIRTHLVAGLDDWAASMPQSNQKARQLVAIARQVDPDPWRDRLREVVLSGNGNGVAQLAQSAAVDELPAATLGLLAKLSATVASQPGKAAPAAGPGVEKLRRAQRRFPADFWINHYLAQTLRNVRPPLLEEAVGYFRAAVALRPQSPGAHLNLGTALGDKGDLDGAIAEFRESLRLKNDWAGVHVNLGIALRLRGDVNGAIAEFREDIRFEPDCAEAHSGLGLTLHDKGDLDGAIAELHTAIELDPKHAKAHNNLGFALRDKGDLEGAIAEHRKAIDLDPNLASSHCGLGAALRDKGDLDGAIAENRKAIDLNPNLASAHCDLGAALGAKGDADGAIAACREAIRLKADYAEAHFGLGVALHLKGNIGEALAEYRKALQIKKDLPEGNCNLGHILRDAGQFAEALTYLRRGHEIGSKNPRWPYPSAQWVKQCERLVELDAKLPKVLKGEVEPADVGERLALAKLCQQPYKSLCAAAVRFYADSFAAQPGLADDLQSGHRYNAACAAALAGCGQGKDAADLDAKERARLRRQAHDYLRADLTAWGKQLDMAPDKIAAVVTQTLQHWLEDTDFNSVRGAAALAKLPEAERGDWHKLWDDVEALRKRAATRP